jgi:hypothetical protein
MLNALTNVRFFGQKGHTNRRLPISIYEYTAQQNPQPSVGMQITGMDNPGVRNAVDPLFGLATSCACRIVSW